MVRALSLSLASMHKMLLMRLCFLCVFFGFVCLLIVVERDAEADRFGICLPNTVVCNTANRKVTRTPPKAIRLTCTRKIIHGKRFFHNLHRCVDGGMGWGWAIACRAYGKPVPAARQKHRTANLRTHTRTHSTNTATCCVLICSPQRKYTAELSRRRTRTKRLCAALRRACAHKIQLRHALRIAHCARARALAKSTHTASTAVHSRRRSRP